MPRKPGPTCAIETCKSQWLVTETLCREHYRESVYTGEALPLDVQAILFYPMSAGTTHRLDRSRWTTLFLETGGLCHVCGTMPQEVIDHDNACETCVSSPRNRGASCGECVRGLLCVGCNNMLGRFNDSKNRLRFRVDKKYPDAELCAKALVYLERYEAVRASGHLIGEVA